MQKDPAIRYSVLDLAPIVQGDIGFSDAFGRCVELAQLAERSGYTRFWLAEHHSIPGVASAATAVVIGHVAGRTQRIRVGAGGIMLPNHAPLVIAEQFGTLESLYPGRIDLGIGRAPGGDHATARALRRNLGSNGDTFPHDLAELMHYFRSDSSSGLPVQQAVRAIPGEGLDVPIYLLGSSDFSARLAADLGLPFAFASHFAPDFLLPALKLYRETFKPSRVLDRPYAMVGVNVLVGETDEAGERLFTSLQQMFLNLIRGVPGPIPPPVDRIDFGGHMAFESQVRRMTRVSAVGSPTRVRTALQSLIEQTGADELVFTAQIFDHADRLRSFELAAEVMREINADASDSAVATDSARAV